MTEVLKPAADRDVTFARRRTLFERLVEIAESRRETWLATQVADAGDRAALRRWLAIDAASGFLDTPAAERAAQLDANDLRSDDLIGQQIGAFTLIRSLGSGGMAAVFLGRRAGVDFEQLAAIKLLRRGLYAPLEQRLFQRERRLLAGLDHPNIARLIDGGITTAGIPYLVMEFVDGVAITQYADDHRLDSEQRLCLFLSVCHAVEAAHRNLIVHRDIKPSNILVGANGVVKLLDFGIAKLIDEDATAASATIGVFTPHYAAPEQLSGGTITTATDVYGLGVLLHELLLGLRPTGTPTRRPSSRVNEAPTVALHISPARLRKVLRGDLDNILLKALADEPERRYASAGALADDLARHLAHRPVTAHPPSPLYRLNRFIQRHRAGVAFGSVFVLALLAALVMMLWQADVAQREALRANSVRGFLEDMFTPINNGIIDAKQQSVHDLLANATAKLAGNTELRAAERVDLQLLFSRLHEKVGEPREAQMLAAQAAELAARALPPDDPVALDAQISHAYALLESNHAEQAEPLFKAIQARLGVRPPIIGMPLVRFYDGMAELADRHDEHAQAAAYERRALAERIATFGATHRNTATGYNNLAISADLSGEHDAAIAALRRAVAIHEATAGPDSMDTAISRINLGTAELFAGRLRAADVDLRSAEAVVDAPPNDKRNRNAYYWQYRCELALARGAADTQSACARSLAATRALLADDATWLGRAWRLEGLLRVERGDLDAARTALAMARSQLAKAGRPLWLGQLEYATALLELGAGDERNALDASVRAIADVGDKYPETTRINAAALRALLCTRARICPDDDIRAARREIDARADRYDAPLLPAQIALARIDLDGGDAPAAAARLHSTIAAARTEVEPAQFWLVEARLWLASAAAAVGDCATSDSEYATAHAAVDESALARYPLLDSATHALQARARCGVAVRAKPQAAAAHE